MINARGETLAEKPAFRVALRSRRCLVLADGFYEWQRLGARKQPFHFRLATGSPFAFAGLWERWAASEEQLVESCAIVTTAANELVQPVHERMPVILGTEARERWLAPGALSAEALSGLLLPYPAAMMSASAVGLRVNSPANDDAACIAPLG
jgi:putative SOS response-associated peptidase YedK